MLGLKAVVGIIAAFSFITSQFGYVNGASVTVFSGTIDEFSKIYKFL